MKKIVLPFSDYESAFLLEVEKPKEMPESDFVYSLRTASILFPYIVAVFTEALNNDEELSKTLIKKALKTYNNDLAVFLRLKGKGDLEL